MPRLRKRRVQLSRFQTGQDNPLSGSGPRPGRRRKSSEFKATVPRLSDNLYGYYLDDPSEDGDCQDMSLNSEAQDTGVIDVWVEPERKPLLESVSPSSNVHPPSLRIFQNPLDDLDNWIANNRFMYDRLAQPPVSALNPVFKLSEYGNKMIGSKVDQCFVPEPKVSSINRIDKVRVDFLNCNGTHDPRKASSLLKTDAGTQQRLFCNLKDLLLKHFMGHSVSVQDTLLTRDEGVVLGFILKRKFKSKSPSLDDPKELADSLNNLLETHVPQGCEGNYRFIFKRVFKHMKSKHPRCFMPLISKKRADRVFYEHYFKPIAHKYFMDMESFYLPGSLLNQPTDTSTTLELEYIRRLCLSAEFVADYFDCLKNHIGKIYEKTIKKRISAIIDQCRETYQAYTSTENGIRVIAEMLRDDFQLKTPVNMLKVRETIKVVERLFQQCCLPSS